MGVKFFEVGHVTLTTSLFGTVCHRLATTWYMINLLTKIEVSIFTGYGNMKGIANVENGVVWD